jgi:phosphoglycerol transferase MdoB-like AlkP superfamily enzyme
MKKNYINYLFIITSLLNSFILFKITCGFNYRFIIGDLIVILLLSSFSYLSKNKKLYFLIISTILSIICVINSLYFNEYNDFVSICLIETFFQALKLPSEAITNVFEIKDFIFLYQVIIFLIIFIFDKVKYKKNKTLFKKNILISFIFLVVLILTMNSNDIYRLNHEWNKVYKARNFGIYSYQLTDILYNFKKLFITSNETIENNISLFYSSKEYSQNEYTNIFKDRNIIFIHAESLQSMFINESINGESITPNLNKLVSSGLYFSNFYSQESVGTSSDTEYTFATSMLPIAVGTTFLNYDNNNLNTIQKQLTSNGYYTFSMHGNKCNYWNRDKMYKSIGYDYYYCYDAYDLSDKIGLGLSDKSFFSQSADIISSIDTKFAATLIMLTNHTPFYNEGKVDFDVSYMEGTLLGDYIKLVHYADEAIGEFINKLDNEGVLDNTVIVIYGDHDAKIKKEEYEKYYNYGIDVTSPDYTTIDFYKYEEISKVPLIIWTKDNIVSGTIDKVMGMIDLNPTISNMLGIDSSYSLGNDIFSTEDNIVVFPNGNWLTDKVYYNNQYSEYKILKDEVDSKYLEEKEKYARKLVEISNDVLKYNLVK